MTFDEAFEKLIGHEGGFQNHHDDSGNWTGGEVGKGRLVGTKYGIAAAQFPGEDIPGLTIERAKELYRLRYWGPAGCDAVPDEMKFQLFDFAVHAGVGRATRMLQRAVGETEDGIIGPRTLQAIGSMPTPRLIARFNGIRLEHLTTLRTWPAFGRGWAIRIAKNLQEA